MRRITIALLVIVIFVVFGGFVTAEYIYFEGERIHPRVGPVIIDGEPQIALVDITNYLGKDLSWSFVGQRVVGHIDRNSFSLYSPTVVNGHLMVPLDFLRDVLGLYVYWDQQERRIIINRVIYIDDPAPKRGIILGLETDKDFYRVGEPIAASLVVLNRSQEKSRLTFSSSQEFDIVLSRGGREIWRWSDDRAFLQVRKTKELGPLDFWQYPVAIPTSGHVYLTSGIYTLEGILKTRDEPLYSNKVQIEIRR